MNEYLREFVFEDESHTVKVCQSPDEALGHGGTVWDAGLVMCAFLESAPGRSLIKGTTCLELGAGTAIVAIAASLLGASRTVASDLPHFVPFMKQNVGLNERAQVECMSIDWQQPALENLPSSSIDWILCADCVYDLDNIDALTRTILSIAPTRGVILCNEARDAAGNAAAEKQFITAMLKNGFVGKGVHRDVIRADWRCDDIHVVVFERRTEENVKGA